MYHIPIPTSHYLACPCSLLRLGIELVNGAAHHLYLYCHHHWGMCPFLVLHPFFIIPVFYNLSARHVRPVEAHGLDTPPVGPVLRHQPHAAMCYPGTGWDHHRAYHVISHTAV